MRILLVLLNKEFRQFIRNPFLPKMVVIFPLMTLFVMPWVMTLDVRQIGVSVVDHDRTTSSRRLVQKIGASDYFALDTPSPQYDASLRALEQGAVDVIVEIPDGFEHAITSEQPRRVSISANGVNAMKGGIGMQYMVQTVMQTLGELRAEQGAPPPSDLITVQNRYNPTLEYRNYMIPALMIMLIIMLCAFLPALNLVGEKESGTIEQINVTPVNRFVFTLSKLIPFWIIGLFVITLGMLVAWAAYGLLPVGSFGAIYLGTGLFILTMSGLGVIVANKSETMQQTMFVMFFFVMIFILLSGLITPIESMPTWAQWITRVLPPRYFIDIMRSVYLKGTTLLELSGNYLALTAFAVVFNLLAAGTYKKQA